MAREKKRGISSDLDIEEKNKQIASLSFSIQKLEDEKKLLEKTIQEHSANQIEYKNNQILLNELIKDIEAKKGIQIILTTEVNEIANKKFLLNQEIELLEKVVTEKKEYIVDVDKFKQMTIVLQKEMETFQDEHSTNKKNASVEIQKIKEEFIKLNDALGNIITNIK